MMDIENEEEEEAEVTLKRNPRQPRQEPPPLFYEGNVPTPLAEELIRQTRDIFAGKGRITDKMPKYVPRAQRICHQPTKKKALINYIWEHEEQSNAYYKTKQKKQIAL